MGRDDDTLTTFEDDLETDDDTDETEDDFNVDDFNDLDDNDEEPVRRQRAQEKVKGAFEKERKQAQQREAALMGSLKEAWGAEAAREFPLADLGTIGLTGIDGEAKEKFLAEVKAQHEAREHALAEAGYVRLDGEGKPIEPVVQPDGNRETPVAGSNIERERQAAAGWGKPVSGTDQQASVRAAQEKELMDSMKQGPKGVIDLMFRKNPGLSDWIKRR